MRVGIVMPLAEMRGGAERMLLNLLRSNRSSRLVDYHVAFLEEGPLVEQIASMGYPCLAADAGRLRDPAAVLRTERFLGKWMEAARPDAVLSWAAKAHLYACLPARRRHIPTGWFLHAIPNGHWMDRLVTATPADLVLCCSSAAAAAQRALWPRRPTRVVNISVDTADFNPDVLPSPADARARLGLPARAPLVVMVARLQRWKGIHVLIDAAARLRDRLPGMRVVVVGGEHAMEPGYRDSLVQQIEGNGLEGAVDLVGLQHNVPLWMQAADVVVHASFDEPAGAVILEAMALGKPVIASRTAGPMEFITDGTNGILTLPGDAAGLAAAIARLMADPDERARLGRAARERAQYFDADRFASRVAGAIDSIANVPAEA
jgi:glycosyltransferase involved in cell wall biosynthesis